MLSLSKLTSAPMTTHRCVPHRLHTDAFHTDYTPMRSIYIRLVRFFFKSS